MTIQEEDLEDDQENVDTMLVHKVEGSVVVMTEESTTCECCQQKPVTA